MASQVKVLVVHHATSAKNCVPCIGSGMRQRLKDHSSERSTLEAPLRRPVPARNCRTAASDGKAAQLAPSAAHRPRQRLQRARRG